MGQVVEIVKSGSGIISARKPTPAKSRIIIARVEASRTPVAKANSQAVSGL
ncbi:hypothetical protein [Bradyrhizobium lablabi]|uniref:hypothetical protein n=1 Tax=Bradyrhizobium lablabi TaxID=722472 RepID=UPI00090CD997|nr:hypothetical protein [Bradyrhizobium lablabi]SHK60475.1 hypothetical protein SAMN05444321_0019 [Bradyrhizobium lablabi]